MPVMKITDNLRNDQLASVLSRIDAGSGPGTIKIYTGTIPADADDALGAQTLLATLTFTDPAAPAPALGVLTFSAITEDSAADATGVAAWARIEDSDSNSVFDCDVTVSGGGGAVEINTVNIVLGGAVRITSMVLTAPADDV